MNLINDAWIPIVRKDGTREKIAPWQIAEQQNPVIEISAPRPDFQGALYQFLIGLLQTVAPPEDIRQWAEYWQDPPEAGDLRDKFKSIASAFELDNPNSIAFLQDFSMPEGELREVAALLIEAPGGKTIKDNLDHFVKAGSVDGACDTCVTTALFTLQINAPSGGSGHRVGVRGGGPLTTLLTPEEPSASLWQKIWLNVLAIDEAAPACNEASPKVFPWCAETRISDKTGGPILPNDESIEWSHIYWTMPRRIRLETPKKLGDCALCGEENTLLFTHYHTKNYGMNYEGPWVHPLTPYRYDPKRQAPPLSLKGQQGGLGYRHWLGFVWKDEGNGDQAAINVQSYLEKKSRYLSADNNIGLWCFGYDMDNMKARCWYEHHLPVIAVDQAYRDIFFSLIGDLITSAKDAVKELRSQIKAAWFSRPKDAKGDTSMIDQSFWHVTESDFYRQLYRLAQLPATTRTMPGTVAEDWARTLRTQCLELFDRWSLEGEAEDMDLKRVVKARRFLGINLNKTRSIKKLYDIAKSTKEVA